MYRPRRAVQRHAVAGREDGGVPREVYQGVLYQGVLYQGVLYQGNLSPKVTSLLRVSPKGLS